MYVFTFESGVPPKGLGHCESASSHMATYKCQQQSQFLDDIIS